MLIQIPVFVFGYMAISSSFEAKYVVIVDHVALRLLLFSGS